MSTVDLLTLISVEDYLTAEENQQSKHEYVEGVIYEMVGATNAHARIVRNVLNCFDNQLRDQQCEPFGSDTKIRISHNGKDRFYYPDVSIVCESNPPEATYQERPVVIVEVLSDSTRRLDIGEKQTAYFTLPTLQYYLLLEQDRCVAVLYERNQENIWERSVSSTLTEDLSLEEFNIKLPLGEAYRDVLSGAS